MSDVMTGRERIVVGPGDTLEGVFERLRASGARELVLDVDARSPLLISLQQLHSLDEVAGERGIQVAIASTNSKLLNAVRVFGMEVIDARTLGPIARPGASGQLLAGQPLGHLDGDEIEARDHDPRPVGRVSLTPRGLPQPPIDDVEDEDAPASLARRVDPYGQAYDEEQDDERPRPNGRTIRPLRPDQARRATAAPAVGEEGWDEDDAGDYGDNRGRRAGLFGGVAAFWDDVRDWVEARRGGGRVAQDEDDADFAAADDAGPEEGWDEPPYQARQAAPSPDADADEDEADATGEYTPGERPQPAGPQAPARPAGTRPIPLPIGRASLPAEGEAPSAHLRPFIASVRTFDDDDDFEREFAPQPERGRAARGGRVAVGGLLGAILALALVGLLILYVVLPTATVTLVARTGDLPVEFGVVVGEIDPNSPEGQPTTERIVVPARRITVPLSASSTKPATGARLEPDLTAGGPVVLTNPSTEAATVPSGTTLEGTDGRSYVTLETVTIGPADPFDAGAFGSATVKVAATLRGSGGNAPVGAVRGRLASGVYYTNRSAPIAGGTDRRITTIARQDVAAAQVAAEEAARGKAQGALAGAIPAGSTTMHDTNGVGNYKVSFNTREGTDGDSVTATATAEVTALVFTPGDVEARARAEAERRIAAAAKPGEPIVPGSIQIAAPQVTTDVPGRLTYKVTGTARTRAAIGGEAERARLAEALAHQDDDAARGTLAAIPGVSATRIDYHTGPFPQRMPWLARNITVRIAENP